MNIEKLFHVLVVGGSLLGASACSDPEMDKNASENSIEAGQEENEESDEENTGNQDQSEENNVGQLENGGFCPNDTACIVDENGASVLREGFICCWSTTC